MHALQKYMQAEMDARGWRQADLSRASGLTTAHISKMMTIDRLGQMPEPETIAGLARAFGVGDDVVQAKALEALGVTLAPINVVRTVRDASNDELLEELRRRLGAGRKASTPTAAGEPNEDRPAAPLRRVARRDRPGPSDDG